MGKTVMSMSMGCGRDGLSFLLVFVENTCINVPL